MNSRNWPNYWHGPQSHPSPNPNYNPNLTTVAGQNFGHYQSQYGNGNAPYGYPTWGYYSQPTPGYWPTPSYQAQSDATTSTMMPPNGDTYQINSYEKQYEEVWESPQSPQSPWIRAYEKYGNDK